MSGIVERWRNWLPLSLDTPVVSLEEGATPLIHAPTLEAILGEERRVFLKFEGTNPTGSFKDRGMALAMSKAVEEGSQGVICASTGNTSAAAAAYAGRAGIPCYVVLPAGNVAAGKLAQAVVHGAQVLPIDGNFDEALTLVQQLAEARRLTLVNSLNPYRIEGQKTIALEVAEALGEPPDVHCLPVGNAGNITATWRGYTELVAKTGEDAPRMLGFQAAGAAPIVEGAPVANPETIATAIRIGNPASWKGATQAVEDSGGAIEAVTDEEILGAYHHLASREGVFCEPASAASVAGLLKLNAEGRVPAPKHGTIVCTLTGHGLKDPDRAVSGFQWIDPLPAELSALMDQMN